VAWAAQCEVGSQPNSHPIDLTAVPASHRLRCDRGHSRFYLRSLATIAISLFHILS